MPESTTESLKLPDDRQAFDEVAAFAELAEQVGGPTNAHAFLRAYLRVLVRDVFLDPDRQKLARSLKFNSGDDGFATMRAFANFRLGMTDEEFWNSTLTTFMAVVEQFMLDLRTKILLKADRLPPGWMRIAEELMFIPSDSVADPHAVTQAEWPSPVEWEKIIQDTTDSLLVKYERRHRPARPPPTEIEIQQIVDEYGEIDRRFRLWDAARVAEIGAAARQAEIEAAVRQEAIEAAAREAVALQAAIEALIRNSAKAPQEIAEAGPAGDRDIQRGQDDRKDLWAAVKSKGNKRKDVVGRAFPGVRIDDGIDRFKKWLARELYPDGTDGDKAIRAALAELSR